MIDGTTHHAVDHVLAFVWKSATDLIRWAVRLFVDAHTGAREDDDGLRAATIVRRDVIVDEPISAS